MARSRPISKFKSYTRQALSNYSGSHNVGNRSFTNLLAYSKTITLALTGSLTFPTPPIGLVAQGAANDALEAAIIAMNVKGNRGSKQQGLMVRAAATVVELNLAQNAAYIGSIARSTGTDKIPQVLLTLSSGYAAQKQGKINTNQNVPSKSQMANRIPRAPQNFRTPYSKKQVAGQIRLRWQKVKGAIAYLVIQRDHLGAFTNFTTTDGSLTLNGYDPTLKYNFKVQAIGAFNTHSGFSNAIPAYAAGNNS